MVDGKTGILVDKPKVDLVVNAINKLKKINIQPADCIAQAQKFSKKRFKKEIREIVQSTNTL